MRIHCLCAPSGGKAFGLLKAQQEERLDEMNKVKGKSKGAGRGDGPWPWRTYPGSGFPPTAIPGRSQIQQ